MISRFVGTLLNKNTADKKTLSKLALALILSNIFFFILFSDYGQSSDHAPAADRVEVQLRAELHTPFQMGKKILLIQRSRGQRLSGVLKAMSDDEGRITVEVAESEAELLFKDGRWEIFPFLKTLSFSPVRKGVNHEIRY